MLAARWLLSSFVANHGPTQCLRRWSGRRGRARCDSSSPTLGGNGSLPLGHDLPSPAWAGLLLEPLLGLRSAKGGLASLGACAPEAAKCGQWHNVGPAGCLISASCPPISSPLPSQGWPRECALRCEPSLFCVTAT